VKDGKTTRRPVTLGVRSPGFVEVVEGVEAGEQVVVGGIEKVSEGTTVTPQVVERTKPALTEGR
jgi:membrane fusion protein (multidrug efflux system)